MNTSILVVDDDDAHRGMLRMMLQAWGYSVDEAADGDLAVEAVRAKPYDVVLTDVRMGRMDGIHALRGILDYNPALPVVLMTAYSSVETAVEALRLGAYDYLTKPLDFDALRETLQRAVDHSRMSVENRELRRQLSEAAAGPEILGRSPAINAMREIIATVAPTEATVLITGESGTGKELVARAVHGASARAGKPLVTVNCAALAENLLESELFGHERGAFTGADRRREGRFLQADGGTLFLDEINSMPLNLQGKVLRALETKTIQRLGSTRSKKVDFRLLTASNEDLYHLVEEKKFRADLYYRLAVIPIRLPPLRERREDIIPLAQHFLKLFCRKYAKDKEFSPQTLQLMIQYPWPGNVRELRNFVERAVVMSLGRQVAVPDVSSFLDPAPASPLPERPGEDSASVYSPAVSARYEQMISSGVSLQQYLDQCGRNYVAYALQKYGNSYKAAEALGTSQASIMRRKQKFHL